MTPSRLSIVINSVSECRHLDLPSVTPDTQYVFCKIPFLKKKAAQRQCFKGAMGTKMLFHLAGSICLTSYEQMLHIFPNAFYLWPEKLIFQQTKHQHPEAGTNHFQNCSPLNWNSLYKNRC